MRPFLLRVSLGALVLFGAAAPPAAADPAGPSDFRSEVTAIVPATDGVSAEIRGGDSFLEVTVDPGLTVIVEGYLGEPYLRFNPDGTVERNALSQATYLNEDRDGSVTIPADALAADETTPPEWSQIATGGTYAWHDHRIHWMSESSPSVERGEPVGGEYAPWRVPIVVDGARVEIQGTLTYEASVSPLPWVLLALGAAGALVWFGRLRPLKVSLIVLALIGGLATFTARAEWASTPGGGDALAWVLALVGTVLAIGAIPLARRSAGVVLALASAATLSGAAIYRIQSLLEPVLPTDLPPALDRASIALTLGASAAVAYLAITSGALAFSPLEDDDPEPP